MKAIRLLAVVTGILTQSVFVLTQSAPNLENGFKNYGSYDGSSVDTVNNLNGNQMLHVPLIPGYAQRGAVGSVQYFLYQTSKTWQLGCKPDMNGNPVCVWNINWPGIALVESPLMLTLQRTINKNGTGTGQVTYQDSDYIL